MEGSFELKSELRGFHWVAWFSKPGELKPADAVLLVGQTQEEAERRARERLERIRKER